jgi:hypothetical protein
MRAAVCDARDIDRGSFIRRGAGFAQRNDCLPWWVALCTCIIFVFRLRAAVDVSRI